MAVEELFHALVEVAGVGAAEAVLLTRVDRLLEGQAGFDQLVAQGQGVAGMNVVVAGAVNEEERIGPGWFSGMARNPWTLSP